MLSTLGGAIANYTFPSYSEANHSGCTDEIINIINSVVDLTAGEKETQKL